MRRFGAAAFALLALLLTLIAAPAISAQTEGADGSAGTEAAEGAATVPPVAVVHQIDATGDVVEASVFLTDFSDLEVEATNNGDGVEVTSVGRASESGVKSELVFVVDASRRNAQGDVFEKVKAGLAGQIASLPNGTRVSVISAGDTATVEVEPTTDLAAASAAVLAMEMSEEAVLFNAIARAGDLVQAGEGWNSTVVVFAGGPDLGSAVGVSEARVNLVTKGAQLVVVSFAGGEVGLFESIDRLGGVNIAATSSAQVPSAITAAVEVASDRLLVSFAGTTDPAIQGDGALLIGSTNTTFSYPGGKLTDRPIALRARELPDVGGISFFQNENGLYIALGLAFAGIGLGIYALGLLFASGESSLQSMLDRYSGDGDALGDEEQAMVQTALVKRAVEFSETFAEDRGFLGKIEELLERAKLPLRPGEAMSIFAFAVVLAIGIGFILTGGILGGLIISLLTGVILVVGVQFKAKRRIRAFEKALPDTLTLLAGTLRAGYSLPQGLEAVSHEIVDPMGYELRRVMTEARLGREIEDALGSTAERLSSPDFAWAVMAIGIQREVGGNLNELLMTVADTMIARERLKGEVATLTAEGKMSAIILGGLPPGLGVVMWIMNPEYINVLFTETLGKVFIGLGFVSASLGMAWMKKVITIDV